MPDMRSTEYIHLGTKNLYFDQCLLISDNFPPPRELPICPLLLQDQHFHNGGHTVLSLDTLFILSRTMSSRSVLVGTRQNYLFSSINPATVA